MSSLITTVGCIIDYDDYMLNPSVFQRLTPFMVPTWWIGLLIKKISQGSGFLAQIQWTHLLVTGLKTTTGGFHLST